MVCAIHFLTKLLYAWCKISHTKSIRVVVMNKAKIMGGTMTYYILKKYHIEPLIVMIGYYKWCMRNFLEDKELMGEIDFSYYYGA